MQLIEPFRFNNPNGKQYSLKEETAVLIVRPRGFHLEEKQLSWMASRYLAV